jgi:hypothetical protein
MSVWPLSLSFLRTWAYLRYVSGVPSRVRRLPPRLMETFMVRMGFAPEIFKEYTEPKNMMSTEKLRMSVVVCTRAVQAGVLERTLSLTLSLIYNWSNL